MSGWISLHRKILKNPILKRNKQYSNFEAWVWLLLRANYDDAKVLIGGTLYRLKEGQMITSLKKLQLQFGWGNSRLNTFLKLLKDDGMIDYKSNTQLTQITILNYSELQGYQTANKSQTTHKQTATKLPPNTNNKNINKENKEIRTHKFFKKVESIFDEKYSMYPKSILADFCDYWTESNPNGRQLRFEKQNVFDINRRLRTWIKRNNNASDETELIKKEQVVEQRYQEQQERLRKADNDIASDEDKKQALGLK